MERLTIVPEAELTRSLNSRTNTATSDSFLVGAVASSRHTGGTLLKAFI
jgi:hypothetical protein